MRQALIRLSNSRGWAVFWTLFAVVFATVLAWWLWGHPGGCVNSCG